MEVVLRVYRRGSIPVSRAGVEALLSVGWRQVLVRRGRWVALDRAGSVLELRLLLLRSLILGLLLGSSVLLLRSLVRGLLGGTVLLAGLLLTVAALGFLVCWVLWSGGSFGVQFGVQIVGFLQFPRQRWRRWQMIAHRLETAGVGLVLDAVQLAVGTRVRVSTGNDLLAQLRADLAVVALLLVLDAVASCVVKVVTSVTVVYVLVAQNRDRGGTGLLESALESTGSTAANSGLTSGGRSSVTSSEGLLRSLLLLLLGVELSELVLGLTSLGSTAKGRDRRVSGLVTGLASWGQVLVRGRRSIQEVPIAPASSAGTRRSRCSIQIVQTCRQDTTADEGTPNDCRFAYHCNDPDFDRGFEINQEMCFGLILGRSTRRRCLSRMR